MKTLIIVLNQAREIEITIDSIKTRLAKPLNGDLAFVGSSANKFELDILANEFKYLRNFPEPNSWPDQFDAFGNKVNWRELVDLNESFESGLIGLYYKVITGTFLREIDTSEYDWFVFTRSDFYWLIDHPPVNLLDKDKIYLLDGEYYDGVCDRHMIISRNHLEKVLKIPDPIFDSNTYLSITNVGKKFSNPESFLAHRLQSLELMENCFFIPYLGFLVRREETQTRWSPGWKIKKLGIFVKYPNEFLSSTFYYFFIGRRITWKKILNNPQKNWLLLKTFFRLVEIPWHKSQYFRNLYATLFILISRLKINVN